MRAARGPWPRPRTSLLTATRCWHSCGRHASTSPACSGGATQSRRSSHRPDTRAGPSTVSASTSRASARSSASRARRGTTWGGG
eukprot:14254220-Alexandrium_andersonii.AAC.1